MVVILVSIRQQWFRRNSQCHDSSDLSLNVPALFFLPQPNLALTFFQLPLSLRPGFGGLCAKGGRGSLGKTSLVDGVVGGVRGSAGPGLSPLPLSSVRAYSTPEVVEEFEIFVDNRLLVARPRAEDRFED